MRRKLALAAALAGTVVTGGLAVGCGGAHRDIPVVSITERDFKISAPHVVPSGDVRLVLHNKGPVSHELVIVRALPGQLPIRTDGFTIDEDGLGQRLIGAIEPQAPGTESSVIVHLVAGRYILLCNMAGHAAGGMQSTFRVR
jgi:uncharacterized cupredoxin-like copper-binding protein